MSLRVELAAGSCLVFLVSVAGSVLGIAELSERGAGRSSEVSSSELALAAAVGRGLRIFGEASLSVGSTFLGIRLTIKGASSPEDTSVFEGISRSMLLRTHFRNTFEAADRCNHRKVATNAAKVGLCADKYHRQVATPLGLAELQLKLEVGTK